MDDIIIDTLNTTQIYLPMIFKGYSLDDLQIPHTFTLYDDNQEIIQTIESPNNEFEFVYQNFDKETIGCDISFSIIGVCEPQDLSSVTSHANIHFVVTNTTISESILFVYNQLKDILDNIGIMTNDAEGLSSLVELVGEDI